MIRTERGRRHISPGASYVTAHRREDDHAYVTLIHEASTSPHVWTTLSTW
ncbi:MAG: hypothetical protein ACRECI_00865 [Methyloceanibacter sp.]